MISGLSVFKKVLLNGMTVLVHPVTNIPKVAMQLTYHVGSKDEESSQKGLAHLIEHMIFKGTKKLSESDINAITHKLSGYTNAFTSFDVTAYIYEFPSQHWHEGFSLLSDCMQNCRFDEQMLNSELKAVIQEMKMYRDDYVNVVIYELLSQMFHDHPYHYPIIGFKQDLWSLSRDALFDFYKQHYVPNNAVLTVVGDVDVDEAFKLAEENFGQIPADKNYKRKSFYHGQDLIAKEFTLHRDIQQPFVMLSTILPGARTKKHYVHNVLNWLLGAGRGSRLTKKLVDDLQLVTALETFNFNLEDATVFFIYFEPKEISDIEKIKQIIHDEVDSLVEQIPQEELDRAIKKVKMAHLSMLESNGKQARVITEGFLFTGDENYIFNYLDFPEKDLAVEVQKELIAAFSPSVVSCGKVFPSSQRDQERWALLQELSDREDSRILEGRSRETSIEAPSYAHQVKALPAKKFHFYTPQKITLDNGLKVFFYDNKNLPKIDIVLTLKNRSDIDPEDKQGLYNFVCEMLLEGTKNYPGTSLMHELEKYGMSFSASPGCITLSMLSEDFEKGLELLLEVLTQAMFEEKALEKIRHRILTDLKMYWDEPREFFGQLVREEIYKGHPYSKNPHGTFESIEKITKGDLQKFYLAQFSPKGASLAIVGDLKGNDVISLLNHYFGSWVGEEVFIPAYPAVNNQIKGFKKYEINRDQIVLGFVRPSVTRFDKDFDSLLLFDQIFSGGTTSSMNSRLFALREQSGLFYTISGSLAAQADEQPGICYVKTIVSRDRLEEAKIAIKKTIDTVVDSITEEELIEAKQAVVSAQVDNFKSNRTTGMAFLAIDRFNFPDNYFDARAQELEKITLEQVKMAARKFLDSEKMLTIEIGRV